MDYLEFIARVTSQIPNKSQVSLEGEPATRFPLPTVRPLLCQSNGDVPASLSPPSHAKHGTVCDQGVIPPWIPRQLWLAKAVMVRYYGLC